MWTTDQQTAIDAVCADNIVSAAAGSGKTAVLVERIIKRVLNGEVDIDKLLVVTFTNAAAAEMKSRLMNKIMEKLDSCDNPDHLNKQLMLINNASICTIDSFCLNVLRNNFYKIGLDPAVKVADGTEVELLKNDLLNEILDDYYEKNDMVFLNIVDSYTSRKDSELIDIILQLFNFSLSLPGGIDELKQLKEKFIDSSVWEEYFVNKAHGYARKAIGFYNAAIKMVDFSKETENNKISLYYEKNFFENVLNVNSWQDVYKALLCFEFPRFTPHKSLSDNDKEEIKYYRNTAKDLYKEIKTDFSVSSDELHKDVLETYVTLEKFIEIVERFSNRFNEEKRANGIVDFSDVEHLTLSLLKDNNGNQSDTAMSLMEKFDEIYVDEYQDCNSIQAEIFKLISRENIGFPNMFRVGDMKQSIYGFRGAEPKHFKNALLKCDDISDGLKRKKIILNKNFRSRKSIIDVVNIIFAGIMSENCGEIDYNTDEYLYYNEDSYKDVNADMKTIDFVLVDTDIYSGELETESDDIEELKGIEGEAIYVANKIKEIVSDENYVVYDKKISDYRRVKYSDIAILLRSGGEKAASFNRILSLASIPVYCEMGEGYYNTPEVVFITNFLKIIDNPYDDVALLSVMRHPVIGFSDDDFVSVRLAKPKGYFYASIVKYLKENDDVLSQKLSKFVKELNSYYESSRYLSTDKLIWDIIQNTDYMSYLSFTENSDLRKSNVNALLTKAYNFEKTSYKGIFDFIRYIDSIKNSNKDIEPAKSMSEDENVVRIMTIHKSKGLEFPVVFLCDSTKQFNENDIRTSKIITHPIYGFGLNFYDFKNYYYYELVQKKFLKEIKRCEMLSEEMRVLYVALTRAREKLIITGNKKNASGYCKKIKDNLKRLSDFGNDSDEVLNAKSYSDWILNVVFSKNNLSGEKNIDELFKFNIISIADLKLNVSSEEHECEFDFSDVSELESERIKNVLLYNYTNDTLTHIPSNMSVTELKRMEQSDDSYSMFVNRKIKTPHFYMSNDNFSAADIGTFTHFVMEKLDFTKVDSAEDISFQVDELVKKGFITKEQALCVNCNNIFRILNTDIGRQLCSSAGTLKREFSFKYLLDACDINPEVTSNEKIVIQGMIDAFFEDSDGNFVIVDYKTDKIKNNIAELKERYLPQIRYYKTAVEKIFKKKVSGIYLFLLDSGDVINCQ